MTKDDFHFCVLMTLVLVIVIGMHEGAFGPFFKAFVGSR
jgi:hypothetical protein